VPDPQEPRDGGPPPPPSQAYPPPSQAYPPPSPPGGYPPPAPGSSQEAWQQPGQAGWAGPPSSPTGGSRGRVLPLRALTVGDVLDGSFRLLRDRFGRVALLVLLVLGPYQLLTSFAIDRVAPDLGPTGDPEVFFTGPLDDELVARLAGIGAGMGLLAGLAYLVVGAAVLWTVLREDEGLPTDVPSALRAGVRRLWVTGVASLLVWLLGLAGFFAIGFVAVLLGMAVLPLGFLFGIPAAILFGLGWFAATVLVLPVAMVEADAGIGRVTGRALSLVRRRFWRFVGVCALVLLVLSLVTFAISAVLGLLAMVAGPAAWVVDGVSGTLVSVITTPVLLFATLLLYLDARVRLEGWDLQLRAQHTARPW
jgi:hypothetical protein